MSSSKDRRREELEALERDLVEVRESVDERSVDPEEERLYRESGRRGEGQDDQTITPPG